MSFGTETHQQFRIVTVKGKVVDAFRELSNGVIRSPSRFRVGFVPLLYSYFRINELDPVLQHGVSNSISVMPTEGW